MPLQSQVLAAVHAADMEIKSAIRARVDGLKCTLSEDPFGISGVELYEDWKTLATLSAAVSKVASEMLSIYDAASQLSAIEGGPLPIGRATQRAQHAALERLRHLQAASSASKRVLRSGALLAPPPQRPLRGNAVEVYALIKSRLNSESFTTFNSAGFAKEIGMSIGSIGAAIDILVSRGYLERGGRRLLKLGSRES